MRAFQLLLENISSNLQARPGHLALCLL